MAGKYERIIWWLDNDVAGKMVEESIQFLRKREHGQQSSSQEPPKKSPRKHTKKAPRKAKSVQKAQKGQNANMAIWVEPKRIKHPLKEFVPREDVLAAFGLTVAGIESLLTSESKNFS